MNKRLNTANHRRYLPNKPLLGLLTLLAAAGACAQNNRSDPIAADAGEIYAYQDDHIVLRLIPRTPEQMAAFYIGRGLPPDAVDAVRKTCFITVLVHNRGAGIVWLDLSAWRFQNAQGEVQRLGRPYWQALWEKLQVPHAKRATFGWTLLPDSRDLRHDEPVGGNLVLQPSESLTVVARFPLGADKSGDPITVTLKDVPCLNDPH